MRPCDVCGRETDNKIVGGMIYCEQCFPGWMRSRVDKHGAESWHIETEKELRNDREHHLVCEEIADEFGDDDEFIGAYIWAGDIGRIE
jgi:hypothetical protein